MVFGLDICAHLLRVAYIGVAVVASLLFGICGPIILGGQKPGLKAEFWLDVWLNFVGAAFGWGALYVVIKMLMWWYERHELGIGGAIVILVAALVGFLGITGRLPHAIVNLGAEAIRNWGRNRGAS
jgi:hypothetical protein